MDISRFEKLEFEPKKIENTVIPKKINNKSVEDKRAELEVLKIEKEIEKLSKPDIPEHNYFEEMMKMQQSHFQQLLEMNKQHNDLKLEIEKLKLEPLEEPDEAMGALEMLKPFLPQILQNLGKESGGANLSPPLTIQTEPPVAPPPTPQETKGGDDNMFSDKTNIKELEEYKAKIRSGEITEQQAYKDFEEAVPPIVFKMTPYAKFKEEFEKIKNGK